MLFSLSPFSLSKKRNQLFLTATCSLFIILSSSVAIAQVSVNHSALNNLGDGHKKENKKSSHTKAHTAKQKQAKEQPHKTTKSTTATSKPVTNKTPAVLPTIPAAPPVAPVFKEPEITVPLHPPAPPQMPKVIKETKGEARITDKHTLIIFDADNVDLNESMMKAVMDFANMLKQHPNATVYLNAYSHGSLNDLSTPRRIALNRGLVIRAVLINQGIPSTRIYLLAKGIPDQQIKDLSPDHVEMIRSDLMDKKQAEPQQNK